MNTRTIKNAVSPVFRVTDENMHRIPIGTIIDAGPHRHTSYGYIETCGEPSPGYWCALGLPVRVVEPMNPAALDLIQLVTP